jgi:hypothetical protein
MKTKITSKNQSGGVTGQNVNIVGNVQFAGLESVPLVKGTPWSRARAWCVGAVGLIASIFGILEYFGIKLWG